jgi:plasmid maintenance system antidote protein VapI
MALRIEAWLGAERGGRASLWLSMQGAYDLWQARQAVKKSPLKVRHALA